MPRSPKKQATQRKDAVPAAQLRIIGGRLRGSKLIYNGDPGTRPMKERVREAAFNLVGPSIKDKLVIDLFAGTGALGLEAISRGASHAMFIERHRPTAATLEENIAAFQLEPQTTVAKSDTFFWAKGLPDCLVEAVGDLLAGVPWAVFCSPPYALYEEATDEMLRLIGICQTHAPKTSCIIVEADARFDFEQLPQPESWDVRSYPPAELGLWRRE